MSEGDVPGISCGSCGTVAPAGSRFCASCGAALTARADERRVVTVLFADLVGFTGLAEHTDPEQVKNLVDRCFERLAADIADHGGRVDKILGDALVAFFGAPIAHEDDAERAVRAGLRMLRTLDEWCSDSGVADLRMRVGVNTGEVLVGSLRAAGDWTAMGDVVNTASRLQTLAEPGTVVVGAETHANTAMVVRYRPLGALVARGREEPVEAWVAEEAIVPPGRRTRRVDVPLVGRDYEISLLNGVVEAAVRRGRAATVVVVAEAGMGKTRLVEEVAKRAACDLGAAFLEGRCVPYGEANVWWPIAEALRTSFGAPVGTGADEARRACRDRVRLALPSADESELDRVSDGLLHLLGESGPLQGIDPTRAREEVTRSLIAYLEGWAKQRPVVVLLSDLHWADDAVLTLADALAERASGLAFVLLATARPSLLERWSPPVGRNNQLVLHLDPLDRQAAAELLDHLAPDVTDDLRELVLDRSGGNPFFLEELVSLLDEGAGRTGVPHTLRGLVAARLDGLTTLERQILDNAAILGRRFSAFAIEKMSEKAQDIGSQSVSDALEGLLDKDLLGLDEEGVYAFRSELVREVAYSTLTKAARIKGHYGVAHWIETHPSMNAADIDRMAYHYATAATLAAELGPVEGVPVDLAARAAEALDRAIAGAEAAELHRVANRLATQALELAGTALVTPEQRLRFLLSRAKSGVALRDLAEAEADLVSAAALAASAGDQVWQGRVLVIRGDLEQKRGDLDTSAALLREGIDVFRAAGVVRETAEALLLLGTGQIFAGDHDAATAALDEALDAFRSIGDRRGEGWALQNLAWVAFSAGRITEADLRCEESIAIFEDLGDRGGMAWASGMLAYVRYHQARFEEAEELCERILAEAEARAEAWATAMMLALRASLRLWTGRAQTAVEPAEEATTRFRAMGDWYGQLLGLGVLARSLVALGRLDEAVQRFEEAMVLGGETTSVVAPLMAAAQLNCGAAQAGRPDLADGVSCADAERAGETGFHDGSVGEALCHLQRGEAEEALVILEPMAETLGEGASGYFGSALGFVRAGSGDLEGALRAAELVAGMSSATYLDRATAGTVCLLVHARQGDAARADLATAEVRSAVADTDDRLARRLGLLASVLADQALGRRVSENAAMEAATVAHDAPGWDTAYRLAAGL